MQGGLREERREEGGGEERRGEERRGEEEMKRDALLISAHESLRAARRICTCVRMSGSGYSVRAVAISTEPCTYVRACVAAPQC